MKSRAHRKEKGRGEVELLCLCTYCTQHTIDLSVHRCVNWAMFLNTFRRKLFCPYVQDYDRKERYLQAQFRAAARVSHPNFNHSPKLRRIG
jgi:hypothetical protein